MKRYILLSITLMLFSNQSFAEHDSYTLVCRGGGSMRMVLRNGDRTNVTVYFAGAPKAASTEMPRRGQCAWLDRPLRSGEPRRFRFYQNRPIFSQMQFISRQITIRGWVGRVNNIKRIFDSMVGGRIINIRVHNDGTYLIVSRFGR